MTRQEAFVKLRTALAALYPDETSARRVVSDAGLKGTRIAFAGSAINTWQAILKEAENANMMGDLFHVTLSEWATNPELRAASEAYQSLNQGNVNAEASESSSEVSRQDSTSCASATTKILFLAANPTTTTSLQLDEEIRSIDHALRQSEYRDAIELKQSHAVRAGDVQELLLRYRPHIVHFSGHGSKANEILLKGDAGDAQPVAPERLAMLFGILKDNVRCVVLNACYSERQARSIAEHIDCVVGMSRAILDSSAIEFATAFYRGLGYGRSIQTAFDLACNQIGLAGKGIVHRDLHLISSPTGQSGAATADESSIPQLISLRHVPSQIVLVGSEVP